MPFPDGSLRRIAAWLLWTASSIQPGFAAFEILSGLGVFPGRGLLDVTTGAVRLAVAALLLAWSWNAGVSQADPVPLARARWWVLGLGSTLGFLNPLLQIGWLAGSGA